jgi:nicotinamide phosphoribosyltransferase
MNANEPNFLKLTDSYKISHWKQYPPGTSKVLSFLESRGGQFPEVTFFGLQYLLKRYFSGQVVTDAKIAEAKSYFARHFGNEHMFNEAGWRHILDKHQGRLPLTIKAVPEGLSIPVSNVLMTVENTDPEVPWLTHYAETLLSQVWYPSTVCTLSRANRRAILQSLEKTGDPSLIDFKLHDFGFRGSTSVESAGIGDAAHLVNFNGTDTLAGIDLVADYYHEPMAGFSIPAAEHSTITSWGQSHEVDAYDNMLTQFPTGLVAVVSDSYDIYHACREIWGKQLKDKVLSRDGVLIVRPDSGYPPEVVVKVLDVLGQAFGYSRNSKGFKVLDPHVRVIQGDGIDHQMIILILQAIEAAGWSADNLGYGSGGGLLQKVDRDTQRFAFKCCAIEINGQWHDVMKNPITDSTKRSKGGRLKLIYDGQTYHTVREEDSTAPNILQTVFHNGELSQDYTFAEIRQRARS